MSYADCRSGRREGLLPDLDPRDLDEIADLPDDDLRDGLVEGVSRLTDVRLKDALFEDCRFDYATLQRGRRRAVRGD